MDEIKQSNDEVTGPERLDTDEQYRTRKRSPSVEREADNLIRTDPQRSTMARNRDCRGGVDDRGVEDGQLRSSTSAPIDWPRSWS